MKSNNRHMKLDIIFLTQIATLKPVEPTVANQKSQKCKDEHGYLKLLVLSITSL